MSKCITCKLFTCNYLKRKGIKFYIDDFIISDLFNKKQQLVLKSNFFKTEEEIIDKLIKTKSDKLPYLLLNILNKEFI